MKARKEKLSRFHEKLMCNTGLCPEVVQFWEKIKSTLINVLLKLTAENERSNANWTMSPVENPAAVDK